MKEISMTPDDINKYWKKQKKNMNKIFGKFTELYLKEETKKEEEGEESDEEDEQFWDKNGVFEPQDEQVILDILNQKERLNRVKMDILKRKEDLKWKLQELEDRAE